MLRNALVGGAVFLLPLVCWPGLARPFSAPKIALLVLLDLTLAAGWLLRKAGPTIPAAGDWWALGWVAAVSVSALAGASVSLEALALALLPVPLFWISTSGSRLAQAVWLGSVAESAVAVLQYAGWDPFGWLGWQPEAFGSPRMRIYGTLGNPNFVAAWCLAALPFGWREAVREDLGRGAQAVRWAAFALQVGAIVATGSRILLPIVALQVSMLALCGKRSRRAWLWALPLAAGFLLGTQARPLVTTVQGRLYLAQVGLSHWRETPVAGYGPGSFEGRFAAWQVEWLQDPGRKRDAARFAGPADHAHNDYLEFLVEYGPLGLAAFLGLAVWGAVRVRRRTEKVEPADAAALGAASLLAIAAADFPFHRPAAWSLFWLFMGMVRAQVGTSSQGAEKCPSQADA